MPLPRILAGPPRPSNLPAVQVETRMGRPANRGSKAPKKGTGKR